MIVDPQNLSSFQADDLTWGKGLGCDFAQRSCKDLIGKTNEKGAKYPYCSIKEKGDKCTYDRKGIGPCKMVSDCPIVVEYSNRQCTDIRDQPSDNSALEEYGEGSRCFEMDPNTNFMSNGKNYYWKISKTSGYSLSPRTHACYKYNCDDGALHILVHDQTFKCERTGMRIDVKVTKDGSIHIGNIYV